MFNPSLIQIVANERHQARLEDASRRRQVKSAKVSTPNFQIRVFSLIGNILTRFFPSAVPTESLPHHVNITTRKILG